MSKFDNIDAFVALEELAEQRKVNYIKAWSIMLVETREYLRQGKSIETILADKEAQINRYAELKADPEQVQQMLDLLDKFHAMQPPLEDLLLILDPEGQAGEEA